MKLFDLWKRHGFAFLALLALIVLFITLSAARAQGASTTITWTHPLTYVDGSVLAIADVKETLITWRRPGFQNIVGTLRVTAPATQTLVTGLTCGSFAFTATTVMTSGAASIETAPVTYSTGVACAPNPPTNLKVT